MTDLVHDHDTKFTEAFDQHFRGSGVHIVKTPILSPMANAYAESWIGTLKRECLNHFLCFSLGHLDHIVQTYSTYYNKFRPHQGLGNVLIPQHGRPNAATTGPPAGRIRREQWLGGLLKHYYRKAA